MILKIDNLKNGGYSSGTSVPYKYRVTLWSITLGNVIENCVTVTLAVEWLVGVKVPSTSSLSVYTKVLAHNLNDIRNWASLIGLLLRICWCLLSVFLIYCSDEWKKLVNLIYCFQVLFQMNFKIMYFLMKILGNTPSADSAASRDSLSSQNATWGIVFFSSFYWWHIEYKGWMCERLLNLQEIYVSGQNICIEVYGNSVGTITPILKLGNVHFHVLSRPLLKFSSFYCYLSL